MNVRPSRWVPVAMAIGFLAMAAMARVGTLAPSVTNDVGARASNGDPFGGGIDVITPVAASLITGYEIPRPDDSFARDQDITHVWVRKIDNAVWLDYANGSVVDIIPDAPSTTITDPATAFDQGAKEMNGQVRTLDGVPVLLVPDGSTVLPDGTPSFAVVEMVVGKLVVELIGHFSNEDILRMAGTVSAR